MPIKILLFLLIASISSCKSNDKIVLEKLKTQILANNESFFESKNSLFQNQKVSKNEWIDKNNNVVKSYTYSERSLGPLSYMPIASFFLPRDYKNYEIITTSRNSAIIDVKEFYSLITLKSEAHCHEAVFTCIKSIK